MEHKQAIAILVQLLDKRSLTAEEQEAVKTAIGMLGWTSLAKSRLKSLKSKRGRIT